jgi:hypothetical protein
MDLYATGEIRTRKASLVKVSENGKVSKEKVSGLEWGPPTPGSSYVLYVGKGEFFRTTPVKELKEIHNALMFRTKNTLYRIEYP